MWVAELKVWRKDSIGTRKTADLDVVAASYYLNAFRKRGEGHVAKVLVVRGKDKEKYKEIFQKHPRLNVHAIEGDQIFYEHKILGSPNVKAEGEGIFFIKPIVAKNGFETWTVASWDKSKIRQFIRNTKASGGVRIELCSLKKKSVDVFLSSALNRLTAKQRESLELAMRQGYYEFPRRHSLEQIARQLGVDESTFREHLRKAESVIMKSALEQAFE
ncbi:MAG TPA: helix-turn-helix domain-containing protein [Candidatus Norongarragalinales archaeon]|nr:helix-turn-helix domain-containing protein [Candidatus Norongarragalinales archaeon]